MAIPDLIDKTKTLEERAKELAVKLGHISRSEWERLITDTIRNERMDSSADAFDRGLRVAEKSARIIGGQFREDELTIESDGAFSAAEAIASLRGQAREVGP